MSENPPIARRPRVCAVSYLNTSPLVWGAVKGPQKGQLELTFAVPSICAERVGEGSADIGLAPVVEMARMGLERVSKVGIACRGVVRSILLVSKVPFGRIETLAADSGSRTSVELTRIVLDRRYGARPRLVRRDPDLKAMLEETDAALLIGDAALAVDPGGVGLPCLDMGEEWLELTGKPMVFAVWCGRREAIGPEVAGVLEDSYAYGMSRLEDIIKEEAELRGFAEQLVRDYFTRNVSYELGPEEEAGLELYLRMVREMDEERLG